MQSLAPRVIEAGARIYLRTWKGSAVTAFLNPVLFLAAMGFGLGSLVDGGAAARTLGGFTYVEFLAPGLLAAAAMQTGAGEATWPVMAGIKWTKTYHAALATPIGVSDLVSGHLVWGGVRCLLSSLAFVVVMVGFGVAPTGAALAATIPATLTGLAFVAPISAYTAIAKNETRLSTLFRFGIIPMFLFSGTFFPVEQLPPWLEPVALITPLWHGVEMCRALALGTPTTLPPGLHFAYLIVWAAAGWLVALKTWHKRLTR